MPKGKKKKAAAPASFASNANANVSMFTVVDAKLDSKACETANAIFTSSRLAEKNLTEGNYLLALDFVLKAFAMIDNVGGIFSQSIKSTKGFKTLLRLKRICYLHCYRDLSSIEFQLGEIKRPVHLAGKEVLERRDFAFHVMLQDPARPFAEFKKLIKQQALTSVAIKQFKKKFIECAAKYNPDTCVSQPIDPDVIVQYLDAVTLTKTLVACSQLEEEASDFYIEGFELYNKQKNCLDAIKKFTDSIQIIDSIDVRTIRALCYFDLKRFQEAENDLRAAIYQCEINLFDEKHSQKEPCYKKLKNCLELLVQCLDHQGKINERAEIDKYIEAHLPHMEIGRHLVGDEKSVMNSTSAPVNVCAAGAQLPASAAAAADEKSKSEDPPPFTFEVDDVSKQCAKHYIHEAKRAITEEKFSYALSALDEAASIDSTNLTINKVREICLWQMNPQGKLPDVMFEDADPIDDAKKLVVSKIETTSNNFNDLKIKFILAKVEKYIQENNLPKAAELLSQAIVLQPDNIFIVNKVYFLRDLAAAKNISIDEYLLPDHLKGIFHKTFRVYKSWFKSVPAFFQYGAKGPEAIDLAFKGLQAMVRQDFINAQKYYSEAQAVLSDEPLIFMLIANLYTAENKQKEAVTAVTNAIDKSYFNGQPYLMAYYLRGVLQIALDNSACAVIDFSRALLCRQNSCSPLLQQQQELAQVHLEELKSKKRKVSLNVTVDKFVSRNHSDCLYECTAILAVNPMHSRAYFLRGKAFTALGKYVEAMHDYNQAIFFAKKNNEPKYALLAFTEAAAINRKFPDIAGEAGIFYEEGFTYHKTICTQILNKELLEQKGTAVMPVAPKKQPELKTEASAASVLKSKNTTASVHDSFAPTLPKTNQPAPKPKKKKHDAFARYQDEPDDSFVQSETKGHAPSAVQPKIDVPVAEDDVEEDTTPITNSVDNTITVQTNNIDARKAKRRKNRAHKNRLKGPRPQSTQNQMLQEEENEVAASIVSTRPAEVEVAETKASAAKMLVPEAKTPEAKTVTLHVSSSQFVLQALTIPKSPSPVIAVSVDEYKIEPTLTNLRFVPEVRVGFILTLLKKPFSTKREDVPYIFGGHVRNILLKINSDDFDFKIALRHERILEFVQGKDFQRGISYRDPVTVIDLKRHIKLESRSISIDLSPCESFDPLSIEAAEGFDFTINGFTANNLGELYDCSGRGLRDLKNKIIDTVQHPDISFKTDTLRVFRAINLKAQLNDLGFNFSQNVASAIPKYVNGLKFCTPKQLNNQFNKLFSGGHAITGFDLACQYGILNVLFGEKAVYILKNDSIFRSQLMTLDHQGIQRDLKTIYADMILAIARTQCKMETDPNVYLKNLQTMCEAMAHSHPLFMHAFEKEPNIAGYIQTAMYYRAAFVRSANPLAGYGPACAERDAKATPNFQVRGARRK